MNPYIKFYEIVSTVIPLLYFGLVFQAEAMRSGIFAKVVKGNVTSKIFAQVFIQVLLFAYAFLGEWVALRNLVGFSTNVSYVRISIASMILMALFLFLTQIYGTLHNTIASKSQDLHNKVSNAVVALYILVMLALTYWALIPHFATNSFCR